MANIVPSGGKTDKAAETPVALVRAGHPILAIVALSVLQARWFAAILTSAVALEVYKHL